MDNTQQIIDRLSRSMKINIGNEKHYVIYIEYQNKVPHSIETLRYISTADKPYWRAYTWYCFLDSNDKNDLCIYNSGSGGDEKSICAPQWIDGYEGLYWLAPGIKLKGVVKNGKALLVPISFKTFGKQSINPFKVGEITHSHEYCECCGYESRDYCQIHQYVDEEGMLRYIKDNTIVE